jgi:hypothetical protein
MSDTRGDKMILAFSQSMKAILFQVGKDFRKVDGKR